MTNEQLKDYALCQIDYKGMEESQELSFYAISKWSK